MDIRLREVKDSLQHENGGRLTNGHLLCTDIGCHDVKYDIRTPNLKLTPSAQA